MVRMKLTNKEFNDKELDVKVEPSKFKRYRGEIPRNGTILIFRVTKMWWTQANDGSSQIFLMAFAEQNKGQLKQYNGLPVREYLTFRPDLAFRYKPFLELFGITLKDIKLRMQVEDEPDKIGDIITSIGGWEVGSDDALCRAVVIRDRYDPDELKAKVDRDGWLPLNEEDEDADEDEDEDDIDEDEDEEEDEEPPARPTRSARGRSSQAGRRVSSRRRAEPEPDEDEDEDEDDIDEEDDLEDEVEDDEDEDVEEEEDEAEDEDEEDEAEDEPPARAKRGSKSSKASTRATSSTRSARSGGSRPATSRRGDGSRSGTRRSTARTERTPGPRGSRGRDGGSREDPPF